MPGAFGFHGNWESCRPHWVATRHQLHDRRLLVTMIECTHIGTFDRQPA